MRDLLRTVLLCAVACTLVAVLGLIAIDKAQDLREANAQVRTWRDIEVTSERLLGAIRDAETGQRGFLLTQDPAYLAPYLQSADRISTLSAALEDATKAQPVELERAREIRALAKKKLAELSETVSHAQAGDVAGALAIIKTDRGRQLMEAIRALTDELSDSATEATRRAREGAQRATNTLIESIVVTSSLSILLLVLLTCVLRRTGGRLRESAERLSITLASVGDAVLATDADGRVERMNPVAETLTGWQSSEACGQALDTVFHIINEQSRAPVESPHHRVLREGKVVGLANHTLLISKDGTERPIEDSGAPIRDADGQLAGTVLVFKDVSERHAAEQARSRSDNRFKAAVAAMQGVLWTNTAEGEMRGEQPGWAALTGQRYEEYQGLGWSRALHPEDAQPTIDAWQEALRRQSPFKFEHRVRMPAGEYRTFSVRAIPVLDPSGTIQEWVGVHTDISEYRHALATLREADQRKDDFLATLAHELRNPVAPIKHAIALLNNEHAAPEQQRWSRAVITRQVAHIGRLLDDLLDSARITRGELSLQLGTIALTSLVSDALDVARPIMERKAHTLDVQLPHEPVLLRVDGMRMAQVLSNLLTNAAKYTDPKGHITLRAELTEDGLTISVADSGMGLSAESQSRIFRMFSQVQSARDRSEGGLGIGLSLARNLMELHGGRIEVASAGEGQGSTFTLVVPASLVETTLSPAQPSSTVATPVAASDLVLIIDDNADAAVSLGMLLELSGHEVLMAHTGEDGLAIAREHRPSAVVIDIGLPGMNGYQVAQALRQEPWGGQTLLIALTGWGQASDKERADIAGFNHHLTKPADPDVIHRLICAGEPVLATERWQKGGPESSEIP